ncbi:DEAD/DEAH box helicase [Candidatus Kaiserbacteria bacterium]|nr:DEAD/DEAH box helicase [Candidatus Kaiserbacteria bacterium]
MPTHRFNKGPNRFSPKTRSGPRPHAGGSPHFRKQGFNSRGGRPAQKRGQPAPFSDISKFINKAVTTEVTEVFNPEHKFTDFQIDARLKTNIVSKGYTLPTPIQDKAIPHVLRGEDVVGIANTGTGKTAAFLVPLVNKILATPGNRVLVMVPTRELALQINDELKGFAKGLGIYGTVCVGGANINPQMSELRRKPAFVIGTPGRLKDLLERRALNLGDFRTAVLDEADRMLDMGFINDMRNILSLLPNPRHTLFFSATLSPEIEKLIGEFLRTPTRISVKTQETSSTIDQDIVRIPRGADKLDVLHDLLITPGFDKVLIFGRTKHGIERLSKQLVVRGIKSESIHGNKSQGQRVRALDLFKKDRVQVLCATDVAARGLDINGVSHVINYDLPNTHDDYVHRIGRTGRAGKRGKALTFISS